MTYRHSAHAIVTLTIEVEANSSWGEGTKIEQIHKQAADDALGYINNRVDRDRRIKIVGMPVIKSVITRRRES